MSTQIKKKYDFRNQPLQPVTPCGVHGHTPEPIFEDGEAIGMMCARCYVPMHTEGFDAWLS